MPGTCGQPVAGGARLHHGEEVEVVAAVGGLADVAQGVLDSRRLLRGEAARPDDVHQLVERGVLHGVPVGRGAGVEPAAAPALGRRLGAVGGRHAVDA